MKLYANELENLDERKTFLEKYKTQKLIKR